MGGAIEIVTSYLSIVSYIYIYIYLKGVGVG